MTVSVTNLVINQNQDFSTEMELLDTSNSLFDFTGYTVTAQIRKHYSSTRYWNFSVSITNPGFIQISLSNAQTKKMQSGRYVYDVILTSAQGFKTRVVEGIATIVDGVTR